MKEETDQHDQHSTTLWIFFCFAPKFPGCVTKISIFAYFINIDLYAFVSFVTNKRKAVKINLI